MRNLLGLRHVVTGLAVVGLAPVLAHAMCGYFSRPVISDIKQPAVLQPSQIAFITWDPDKKVETVTVQPRFEGDALDFGMVIPTPNQPKLHEMPRDFFKALGVFTQPKKRAYPESRLLPRPILNEGFRGPAGGLPGAGGGRPPVDEGPRQSTVKVVEVGLVGNLDYKIIIAGRPDDLYTWLKDNKYSYAGDEATLDFYVRKKYYFTVMKIDTLQMKKGADGKYTGDVTPTKFTFASDRLVYPLKITQVSVKDKTEALFYVQAPFKVDLAGDQTYQMHWLSLLQHVEQALGPKELLAQNHDWLSAVKQNNAGLLRRGQELGYFFPINGQALRPNKDGHLPTTLEWAKRLTADDLKVLSGDRPYSETVPDPDAGFAPQDLQDGKRVQAIFNVIQRRLEQYRQARPRGYLVRDASKEDIKALRILQGHLQEGQVLTKFDHVFTKDEMNDDLVLVPARVGDVADRSEHEELLRTLIIQGPRGPRFPLPGGPGLPPGGIPRPAPAGPGI
jgi:hypothetical protein